MVQRTVLGPYVPLKGTRDFSFMRASRAASIAVYCTQPDTTHSERRKISAEQGKISLKSQQLSSLCRGYCTDSVSSKAVLL